MLIFKYPGVFPNIFLISLFSYFPLFSCDLTNKECSQAEYLYPSIDQELCFTSCNNNGLTRSLSSTSQGCEASPFQTVWYSLTSPSYKSILSLKLHSTALHLPIISVYSGNCDQLELVSCNQAYDGSVSIQNLLLDLETEYYLAISTTDGSVGEFEFCLQLEENTNVCNTKPKLEIISTSEGSPTWGPYLPGEEIEVCYTIDGYENLGCNYLQAIVPILGNGWDPTSFDFDGQPKNITQSLVTQGHTNFTTSNPMCEGDPAGDWRWYREGKVQYKTKTRNNLYL